MYRFMYKLFIITESIKYIVYKKWITYILWCNSTNSSIIIIIHETVPMSPDRLFTRLWALMFIIWSSIRFGSDTEH